MIDISKETAEKITILYNGLQDQLQDLYRKSLRPLYLFEFNTWFDDDKLGYKYGIPCYLKYRYQKDIDTEPIDKFCEVTVVPWTWKKVESNGSYHYEMENEGNVIGIYSRDKHDVDPYVYPLPLNSNDFEKLGIYCDPDSEYIHGHEKNPIMIIKKYYENLNN